MCWARLIFLFSLFKINKPNYILIKKKKTKNKFCFEKINFLFVGKFNFTFNFLLFSYFLHINLIFINKIICILLNQYIYI